MTYYILSTSPAGRVASRFLEEFRSAGGAVEVVGLGDDFDASTHDVIFPRIAPEQNTKGIEKLTRYSQSRIINPPQAWAISRDKARAAAAFASYHIPTPQTVPFTGQTFDELASLLGTPFILKVVDGTHGQGVYLVSDEAQLASIVHNSPNLTFIAQTFIAEAAGGDIRFIVVGDTVVAAMTRQAARGDFRSNLHLGGQATAYHPSDSEAALAVQAAKSLGLEIAGVDCVRSANGLLVLEVNPSPGLQIESITGVNVAKAMAEYVIAVGGSAH